MDRGAMFAEEHDQILRQLPETTGKPLSHWFALLDKERIENQGFLAGLTFLRDRLGLPHQQASAVTWAFLNPSVLPDEMLPEGSVIASGEAEEHEETDEETAGTATKPASRPAAARTVRAAKKKAVAAKRPKAKGSRSVKAAKGRLQGSPRAKAAKAKAGGKAAKKPRALASRAAKPAKAAVSRSRSGGRQPRASPAVARPARKAKRR